MYTSFTSCAWSSGLAIFILEYTQLNKLHYYLQTEWKINLGLKNKIKVFPLFKYMNLSQKVKDKGSVKIDSGKFNWQKRFPPVSPSIHFLNILNPLWAHSVAGTNPNQCCVKAGYLGLDGLQVHPRASHWEPFAKNQELYRSLNTSATFPTESLKQENNALWWCHPCVEKSYRLLRKPAERLLYHNEWRSLSSGFFKYSEVKVVVNSKKNLLLNQKLYLKNRFVDWSCEVFLTEYIWNKNDLACFFIPSLLFCLSVFTFHISHLLSATHVDNRTTRSCLQSAKHN